MTGYYDLWEMGWHRRVAAIRSLTTKELDAALELSQQMVAVQWNLGTGTLDRDLSREQERRARALASPPR